MPHGSERLWGSSTESWCSELSRTLAAGIPPTCSEPLPERDKRTIPGTKATSAERPSALAPQECAPPSTRNRGEPLAVYLLPAPPEGRTPWRGFPQQALQNVFRVLETDCPSFPPRCLLFPQTAVRRAPAAARAGVGLQASALWAFSLHSPFPPVLHTLPTSHLEPPSSPSWPIGASQMPLRRMSTFDPQKSAPCPSKFLRCAQTLSEHQTGLHAQGRGCDSAPGLSRALRGGLLDEGVSET